MTTITLPPDIGGLLCEEPRMQGTTPELLILERLREYLACPIIILEIAEGR